MASKREAKTITVQLPTEVMEWASETARLAGVSVEMVIRMITAMYVMRYRADTAAPPVSGK